ncbi:MULTISPECIES: molybdenum cofactor biosynthesis protein B [unclassified Fusibacter]|uniref:MogA/MoaB family molybdenum cofactor biosynthesis protein n=1 Tax=unclassified Fusibacter TaxID=2624464 RepID=UPI001011F9C0|nr:MULTISPECIES: MogA/MoaB family molybdenum cofactor biosynthesis protein [unclassified Fusibacter]MCK8061126.1 MogA/MoaB family molybdenum cofactor biosynthesis protein [Fusibacter sp. A2]NPE23338.1 MogA/MoaB family molybdenum cofactor biosynthesis protein [Fusibacter sp. A1]RXV59381.1 MogA/MoaB family molybdenum cofactor biosynthesis protein [Fusibacter sp. A1]
MRTVGIIVASDQGSKGLRVDESGELIRKMLEAQGYQVLKQIIVSDDLPELKAAMMEMADDLKCHLILTTGGTGFSKRDNTPEATLQIIERACPGVVEAMRWISFQKTPKAMLSRAVAGIRGDSIIINLPGSPKAVKECLEVILEPIAHGIDILIGDARECASK